MPDSSLQQLTRYRAALKPDHHNKGAYIGKVTQTEKVMIIAEDGTSFEKEVTFHISWDSISKILGLIKERAES